MLTSPPTASPTPLGGGGRIVSTDPQWYGQIIIIEIDGKYSQRLNVTWWDTPGAPGYAMEPAWSPDGSKIAFAAYLNPAGAATANVGRSRTSEIFVADADGNGLIRLTNNNVEDEDPAWSPDGTKIAFACGSQICVMKTDAKGPTRLTHGDTFEWQPSWSPNGMKIAFSSGFPSDIYSMNADGTDVTQLTNDPGNDFQPDWSPDGTKIAFASDRKVGYGIYLMNPDGSAQTSITGPDGYLHPSWSPDGKMIAYALDNGGMFCLMRPDGSATTCHFGTDNWVSWSRH